MDENQKKWLGWGILAVVMTVLSIVLGVTYPVPPAPEDVEPRAAERVSVLCATEGGNCVESWNGSDIVVYSDEKSTQKFAVDGETGDVDTEGDLDFNGDLEIGGVQTIDFNEFGASTITTDTTTHLVEVLDSTPIMTAGTNILSAINIDLGIGNSTAGTNSVYGILVDTISQDAQNTETALYITNGWDRGIDLDGNALYMDNDNDSYFSELADDSIGFTPGAATGSLEIRSGNLQVGDGSPGETHNGEDFYVEGISEFDGTAYFDGAVDVDGTVTANGDMVVDDTLNVDDTDSVITGTQTLTPTGTFYELNPGSALTVTLATGSAEVGDLLIVTNVSAQAVIIADTGATVGGGTITLNTNDLAMFIYTNTKWVEIASPDNS